MRAITGTLGRSQCEPVVDGDDVFLYCDWIIGHRLIKGGQSE